MQQVQMNRQELQHIIHYIIPPHVPYMPRLGCTTVGNFMLIVSFIKISLNCNLKLKSELKQHTELRVFIEKAGLLTPWTYPSK
ncbi:hypothetical protein Ga0123461_2244 [Mariprofundus aestuarium]|uniref:Uncharacterized protein n=1 Tax=Mariprofundus aestuarium TaxID=1921086 RepID=A0A2K8L352_MARES|nr:hypothetical protein Ga0123461_2244 [Mariprofundus aestuarium]